MLLFGMTQINVPENTCTRIPAGIGRLVANSDIYVILALMQLIGHIERKA